jgi:hypothetical protein
LNFENSELSAVVSVWALNEMTELQRAACREKVLDFETIPSHVRQVLTQPFHIPLS